MRKQERANAVTISRNLNGQQCIWQGKPSLLPYILLSHRMLVCIPVTLFVFWYYQFTWFFLTKIWTVMVVFWILQNFIDWIMTKYYITDLGLVVKKFSKYHCMPWDSIRDEEYKIKSNPVEVLFGCRTVRYAKFVSPAVKGRELNIWRYTAAFWCIRDHKKVTELIRKYRIFHSQEL